MTNSYKALLFRSIIEIINNTTIKTIQGDITIKYSEICAGMIAQAIYPLQVFKLSFGKSDMVHEWLTSYSNQSKEVINALKLSELEIKIKLEQQFLSGQYIQLENQMLQYVLARLTRPWFNLGKVKDGKANKLIEIKCQKYGQITFKKTSLS